MNDFMCEFLALYVQQQLIQEEIQSRVEEDCIDHYVVLEDGNKLFPGKEWGSLTGMKLPNPEDSLLF